jgi:hypothetical protein
MPAPIAPTSRPGRRLLLGVAGGLPALVTLTVGVAVTRPSERPGQVQKPAAATPDPAVAARLHHLADHITATPADQHSGPNTYSYRQSWTAQGGFNGPGEIGRVDVQIWQHINGSKRLTTRRLPSWPSLDHIVDGSDRSQFADAPAKTDDFTAAQLPPRPRITPETIATQSDELAVQLQQMHPRLGTDPEMLLFTIMELGEYAYLGHAQRATLLRLLADVPGLCYDGEGSDVAGRTGVTVRYTEPAQAATTWLTINPITGEPLAHRRVLHRPHGRTVFNQYSLLLEHDRREHL